MKQQWRLSTGCGCSDFHGVVGVGGRKCTAEAGFGYRVQEQRHDFPVLPPILRFRRVILVFSPALCLSSETSFRQAWRESSSFLDLLAFQFYI